MKLLVVPTKNFPLGLFVFVCHCLSIYIILVAVRFSKKGNLPTKSPFGKNESSICKTMLIVKTNILGDKYSKTTQLCSVTDVSLNYGIGSSFQNGKTYCAETAYPSLSAQVIY